MPEQLLITADFPPVEGGIANYQWQLVNYSPVPLRVITGRLPGSAEIDKKLPFPVHRFYFPFFRSSFGKIFKPFLFALYSVLLVCFLPKKVSAVHCGQLAPNGLAAYLLWKIYRIPYFLYIYGAEFRMHRHYLALLKPFWKSARGVIVCSEFARQECQRQEIPAAKIFILYPGVNTRRFKPGIAAEKLKERCHLSGGPLLLTVSRLDSNKGIDTMIKLLPELCASFPQMTYLVAGRGPEEGFLRNLVQRLKLEKVVNFLGYLPEEDLPALYNLADLFVLLTREVPRKGYVEGFGIVFLEASACAMAIIAGRTGGVSEAVIDGKSGLLVDATNPAECLTAIRSLLSDPNRRNELGRQGRWRVEQEFRQESRAPLLSQWIGQAL